MDTKQTVDTIKADMRVLNELTDKTADTTTWLTPAFWTMATAAVTNLVTVAVLIGWVDAANAEGITKATTAVLAAAQVIVVNTALVWKYIAGQNALQAQKIQAQRQYLETVAIERLRAANDK